MLVTDLIPEEAESWTQNLLQHQLDPIFLVAPTTSDKRLARIAQQATDPLDAVSRAGVTGARDQMTRDAEALVKRAQARRQRFTRSSRIRNLDSGTSALGVAFRRRGRCRAARSSVKLKTSAIPRTW